ncbi:alpha/beta hydrolase fold domain-containing protein [Flavobacteriaceae bacterium]|nr:alpha/beta hydrolase fold domain-containing protein [Flavobacteriaceae bacterium]MDC0917179.1 alpha/beta hydrolase fold domain-containing protein [Flavobacteriaceae bacterium]MDC3330527.1 alpha/beta hydrolase fold domain-containing protein [Flavobacteriaceae bacterium]
MKIKPSISCLSVFIMLIITACSESNSLESEEINALETALGVGSSPTPIEGNYLFFKDVTYGTRERNRLDILLPQSDSLNGAVLFFHGGAFLFGTKEDLYEGEVEGIITALLAQNIAVVNAEYTFINDSQAEGVLSSLEDGAAVIQFITSKASALNLPSNKLILAGVSAGAGIAQWNGFRVQSNSQVQGVFATLAQSSYDLYQWEQLFPDFSLDSLRATSPELEALFVQFYNGVPTEELSKLLDYRSQIDATDPPLYVYNPVYDDVVVTAGNPLDFNVLFHSYKHADFLRKKAIEVGLDYSGAYQESPVDFILRRLLN